MLVNKGDQEGLFRGAVMQSGGPIPIGDIEHGQPYYDIFVKNAACDKSHDTLECLRSIPYARFKYAMDSSPDFFAYQVKADVPSVVRIAYWIFRGLRWLGYLVSMAFSSRNHHNMLSYVAMWQTYL
jgi:hypothetical protein